MGKHQTKSSVLILVPVIYMYEFLSMFTREILRHYFVVTYHHVYHCAATRVESNTNLTVHRHLVDPKIHEEVHPVNHLDLEQYNTSFTVPGRHELVNVTFRGYIICLEKNTPCILSR